MTALLLMLFSLNAYACEGDCEDACRQAIFPKIKALSEDIVNGTRSKDFSYKKELDKYKAQWKKCRAKCDETKEN